jgi:hypothetical protein
MIKLVIAIIFLSHSLLSNADCVTCAKKLQGHDVTSAEKLADESDKIAKQITNKEKGIWGEFYLKQICGSLYAPAPYNKDFPLNYTHKDLGEPVTFKIGADGFGKVEASKVCRAEVPEQLDFKYDVGSGGKATWFSIGGAIFSMVQYAKKLKEDYCVKGSQVKGDVSVNPARNFFGGKLNTMTKNLGFYRTKVDPHLADKACSHLFAAQFVNFGDKLSCIGYKNKQMDEVHIYTVNAPDPYLTRMILRQKHNFNQGDLSPCQVSLKD